MPALRRMDCIILGLVSSATCLTLDDVISFIKKTFFGHIYYTKCQQDLKEQFDSALTQEIKELATKGFLEEREGAMTITELGRICAQELLLSDTILILHDAMKRSQKTIKAAKNYEEISQGLIHLACCTPDSDLLYPPTSKPEVEELQAIWETRKDKFLAQPDDHNLFLRSLRTSRMLARWIDGVPFSELEAYAPHGVIRRIAETTVWIMNGMLRLADERVLNLPEPFRDFQAILVQRVHYGTPSTALALLRLRIPGIQRIRAMKLAEAGFDSIDSLIRASTSDLTSINGINQTLALRIKEGVERFIEDDLSRQKEQQKRVAQELGRDSTWIQQLYEAQGDSFARVCMDILRHGIGLDAVFVGDAAGYDVDGLVTIPDGRIAIECKRKAKGMVSANEAGEVLSKGAQHNPIAYLAIGFPDFTDEAKRNAARAKIALLRAPLLAEILLGFWEAKLSKDEIVAILRSENYVADIAR